MQEGKFTAAEMQVAVSPQFHNMPIEDKELREKGRSVAAGTLRRMNDRQFLEWLCNSYPEVANGSVNIGVMVDGNTIYRFASTDVFDIIQDELELRMGAARVTPDMVIVKMPKGMSGYNPVEAVREFLNVFEEYASKGPAEPAVFKYDAEHFLINHEWVHWYRHKHSVDANTAWKEATVRIAAEVKIDLNKNTAMPVPGTPYRVVFVQTIDQLNLN